MDTWIVLTGLLSFIVLLVSLPIVFRLVAPFAAVGWYIRMTIIVGILCIGCWNVLFVIGVVHPINSDAFYFGAFTSVCIYGLLSIIYLFGIFGTIESSITLRLLTIIARNGKQGMHQNAIISSYSRKSIVTRRVDRLLYSGELVTVSRYYRLSKRASYTMWREYFFHIFTSLFPDN